MTVWLENGARGPDAEVESANLWLGLVPVSGRRQRTPWIKAGASLSWGSFGRIRRRWVTVPPSDSNLSVCNICGPTIKSPRFTRPNSGCIVHQDILNRLLQLPLLPDSSIRAVRLLSSLDLAGPKFYLPFDIQSAKCLVPAHLLSIRPEIPPRPFTSNLR